MEQNVKLTNSPFSPNIEVVGDMVMKLHSPYSQDNVTIQFNPNIIGYQENQDKPGIKVRQFTFSTPTDQTIGAEFDFKKNNARDIKIDGTVYNVRLMSIGKENLQGQDFPFFDFFITW